MLGGGYGGGFDVFAWSVGDFRQAWAVVDGGDAQFGEAGHIGPAELGSGLAADGGEERRGEGGGQAGAGAGRVVQDGNFPCWEQVANVAFRLLA